MKILNTKTVSQSQIKALIYGASGAGKTTLAATMNRPTLIVSAESGLLSLVGTEIDVIDLSIDDEGKPVTKDQRVKKLREVYAWLLTDEAKKKYEVLFIDSLTEINLNMLEALNIQYPDRKDSLVMYGELAKNMRALITLFRDLPHYSVIFTALDETDKDENGFRFQTIQLVGSFASKIAGYFDEVFYLNVDKDSKRHLVTAKTDKIIAKDRSGKLDAIEPSDLGLIFDKILGKQEQTNKKG
jgi:phage nucleotide-binding protein